MSNIDVVIMAAGKGTRMHSSMPKVLHRLGGRALLQHVIETARQIQARRILVITGHAAEQVEAVLSEQPGVASVRQMPQLGTGHALLQAESALCKGVTLDQMPVRMMLANDELRTVLVSIHLSLRQAIDAITVDNILETLRITHRAELAFTGRAPHLAVAGLNPHAGEGGLLGREEIDVIQPAIEIAKAEGMIVSGPWSPDTVFMRARAERGQPDAIDVVVAMYHDQGLIPVKYLGVEQGVNITLGLPFVRTSPDHGTAFDLAGRGVADPSSLLEALAVARRLAGVGFGA
jgi:4-hydroxythreonine-4-phosphate dehydrogenase